MKSNGKAEEMATISQIQTADGLYDITLLDLVASVAELNYSCGLTASIQSQLDELKIDLTPITIEQIDSICSGVTV